MSYHLDYVDKPERFDEVVEQGGVKVVIDSKALFSIIGSTMDWKEDALGAKFVFDSESCTVKSRGGEGGGGSRGGRVDISRPRSGWARHEVCDRNEGGCSVTWTCG